MERLTEKNRDRCEMCTSYVDGVCIEQCYPCDIYETYARLAAIEDILGDDYDLSRLRDLVQADRDGRCVVLSEPMVPMVQRPGDTDVYCPNCGNTLSGGWTLSEADDYRKMCQCPNCGQAIDDTKCEFSEEALRGEKHG